MRLVHVVAQAAQEVETREREQTDTDNGLSLGAGLAPLNGATLGTEQYLGLQVLSATLKNERCRAWLM